MNPSLEASLSLLIQVPLVGIFIWYSLNLWKRTSDMQDKFMAALDRRDQEFEKRNNAICNTLAKLTEAIDTHDTFIEQKLDNMAVEKAKRINGLK
jgi:hypothetical protein